MLANLHLAVPGAVAVALVLGALRRDAVLKIDWLLLLIFVLMFVVLRGAAALPVVHQSVASLGLDSPLRLYTAGAAVSQLISNVPAAILLSEFSGDWRVLAFGVGIGGFGLAIGSLANLIAVRLARTPGLWGPFHLVCIPFGLVAYALGALWLYYTGSAG
ncbi:MAG: Inner membrane protein YbiR [Burkholderia lata]|uniref:Inner membrane protein YbiR n=1 Tax=Burkholderia lata (strain ATCC 17760 / DSM 23089 / LMG 22485 / NCIMB 9086 / R18194 / 383) TaxID=482957 RepID=A0A833PJT8_BURL3|nr:MAG: Inner membrane protein YbiR [Burkholderia lata]